MCAEKNRSKVQRFVLDHGVVEYEEGNCRPYGANIILIKDGPLYRCGKMGEQRFCFVLGEDCPVRGIVRKFPERKDSESGGHSRD